MTPEKEKNRTLDLKEIRSQELRIATATLYQGNVIAFRFMDDVVLQVEDVIELSQTNVAMTGDNPYFTIVVTGQRQDITQEAREYDFYKELGRKPTCVAEAVIVHDLPTRIVVDFYYKLRRFPYPAKVFANEEQALEWFRTINPNL
ncbi:MAG: hypothetical protein JST26_05900 [Bacteroidetes bacterium]|nr:hypothetical protein [Bacteroidota bacterium]